MINKKQFKTFRPGLVFTVLAFLFQTQLPAQEVTTDTLITAEADTIIADTTESRHSPRKAVLMSAILPGLGQVYNGKWWKVPIIYGGLGTLGFMIDMKHGEYREFFDLYRARVTNDTTYNDTMPEVPDAQLLTAAEGYKRNRDLFIILTAGVYVLNILDAAVDAHLYDFDVSEDLSMRMSPGVLMVGNSPSPVLGLTFKF